ncbi:MAG: peptide ABC transporter substrate-binding protein [Chloroflexota bacterium]
MRIYCCATDVRSLRPQAASGWDEISVINGLQRGLLYRDRDGKLVPSLATDLPTVSSDLQTYTYHLRPDAQYSDGAPILAADLVRAARQLADPRNAFDFGYLMCPLQGASEVLGKDFGCPNDDTPWLDPQAGTFDDGRIEGLLDQLGLTAPDDHTVVFRLEHPASFWPDISAMWLLTPVPESATSWAEAGDIVSSGPFVLSEWTHNSKMVLTPNPNWYGTMPKLQRIEISIGGDPGAAVDDWKQGDLDEVRVPSYRLGDVLSISDYRTMVNRSNALSVEYWDFANCNPSTVWTQIEPCPVNDAVKAGLVGRSPMQNVHFRQALTQAIDKADMIEQTFAGIGIPAYSPTMPGISGFPTYTAETTPLPFNPDVALVNLATALAELGVAEPKPAAISPATDACDETCQHTKAWAKMLDPMRFNYSCDAGHDVRVVYMAEQWRQVLGFAGDQFDVRCTNSWGLPFHRPSRTAFYDVARDGWGADFPHADDQNRPLFSCGAPNNQSTYCNPAYDALLDQGARASDYAASLPFYRQAEQLLVQDAPVLFVRYGENISLIRPWVVYTQSASDQQNVGDAFYEDFQILAH